MSLRGDHRGRHAAITPAGTALLRKMRPVYCRGFEDAFDVDDADAATIAASLGGLSRERAPV